MMTLEQLNAIRQRAEKAKAGRWMSLETNTLGPSIYDIVTEAQEKGLHYGVCVTYHRGTADFLAHSISDIPALLDEVEALQREVKALRDGYESILDYVGRDSPRGAGQDAYTGQRLSIEREVRRRVRKALKEATK